MNFYWEIVSVFFALIFLSWILVEIVRGSRRRNARSRGFGQYRGFSLSTIILNVIISVLYLGFGLFDWFNYKTIKSKWFFSAIAWILASVVVVYSKFTILNREKKWPVILIFWWVFSTIIGFLCVFRYLSEFLKFVEIPDYFPQASVVDVASFPLSLLLCFFNIFGCTKNDSDLQVQEPLLQNENNESQVFTGAGIWSRISFQWLNELFETGRAQKLEFSHVPSVPVSERADNAANVLEQSLWHQKIEDASLTSAILHATWKSMAINAVFAGINTAASYTGPFLITNLVNYLLEKSEGTSFEYGFLLAFIIFFSKTLESVTQRQWYFGAHRIGLRVQAALTVLIYKMSISMKYSGPNSGKIINLINVDAERIGDCCLHIHGVWLLPLQVFLAFAILYGNLGVAPAFATLLTTVLVVVCNVPLVKMQKSFESNIMEAKDSRIKKTSEILKSMRVLKLHGWEQRFLMKLLQLRETERSWLKRYLYTCSAVAFLFWTSPTLVSVVTFGVCILVKTPLTAGTVLSTLATLRILQEAIYNLPELISIIARTKVSLYRVCEFIKEDRRNKPIHCHTSKASSNIGIKIEKGEYTWETSDRNLNKLVLKIMEKLSVVQGYKVAICGSVGSGKSSLLYSILGEIPRISGTRIKVYGTKAIVPQTSWIQTGTVRDNVLFGKNMDGAFYEHVLKACALDQDIKMWANGDLSLIGERGINLSGGQKQRIQLGRAVYSDSDVYFLDDPFSAVDAHTGTHLFKKCLMQLLSNKTVVYTTHQLEFLEAADLVLVIKDGLIAQSGKFEDLIKNPKGELVCQLAAYKKSINQLKTSQKDNPCDNSAPHAEDGIEELKEQQREPLSNGKLQEKIQEEEEEAETGRVKWGVYSTFLTSAYGGAFIPIILLCHVFFQGLQMASNYWLAWATEKQGRVNSNQQLIGIFILLSFGSSAFILGRAVFLSTIALETGKNLFHGMTTAIFRAPISFFDLTPSSRILSRCSTDQSTIDTNIPYRVAGLVFAIIQLFFVIALMSHVAWEIFLLFLLVIGISLWYQAYYITTARELARMVGIRKAPILHHFSESITGATTIRCFNQEDRFLMKLLSLIDDYSRVAFHNAATMEWLSVRTNFLFNLVFFLVLIILVSLPPSTIDPSLAGLAATYGLNLNVLQAWIIWNMCNVENKMISVERILQFTNIPSEAPLVIEKCRPNPEWPSHGRIELENLHVQYNPDLPMVLKGITCTFPGNKKIGIVGRTGSGKSTLIQALFRVMEPSRGRIVIDGIDISEIGLLDLRSRLGIIPQDPTLFQGTIRTNLDPLEQHTDKEIWEVLNKCRLAEIIRQDIRLLDEPVSEDGQNWSVGQRQLVCLARVLMNRRKILVLDEATASIDIATDNFIQQMIKKDTSGCTVITVAHRIPTVIDSDLVLVLDGGNIVEYDAPARLLEDSSSSFSKLVAEFSSRSSRRTRGTS